MAGSMSPGSVIMLLTSNLVLVIGGLQLLQLLQHTFLSATGQQSKSRAPRSERFQIEKDPNQVRATFDRPI